MSHLSLERAPGSWNLLFCEKKLSARGNLPGAFIYDSTTQTFRQAVQRGCSPAEFLAPALTGSWMVNNPTTSHVMQTWLQPPHQRTWMQLIQALQCNPLDWLALNEARRNEIQGWVESLLIEGQSLTSVSKVLAQLCPELVPLLDDAAIWFALEALPYPSDPRKPTATAAHFLPMLDWFARQYKANEATLVALSQSYAHCHLSPPQVLDRLLWFESWGYHIIPGVIGWRWLHSETHEGIIPVPRKPIQHLPAHAPITIAQVDNVEWQKQARLYLEP